MCPRLLSRRSCRDPAGAKRSWQTFPERIRHLPAALLSSGFWEAQLFPPKDMLQALPARISLQLQEGAFLQGQAGFWDGGGGGSWQEALEFLLIPSWTVPRVPEGDKRWSQKHFPV